MDADGGAPVLTTICEVASMPPGTLLASCSGGWAMLSISCGWPKAMAAPGNRGRGSYGGSYLAALVSRTLLMGHVT